MAVPSGSYTVILATHTVTSWSQTDIMGPDMVTSGSHTVTLCPHMVTLGSHWSPQGPPWSPQGPTQSPWGPTLVTYTATKWALAVTIRSHMAATKPHKPSFGHWGVLHGHLRVPQGPSVSPWIRPSRHAASSGPPSTAIAANLFSAASLAQ